MEEGLIQNNVSESRINLIKAYVLFDANAYINLMRKESPESLAMDAEGNIVLNITAEVSKMIIGKTKTKLNLTNDEFAVYMLALENGVKEILQRYINKLFEGNNWSLPTNTKLVDSAVEAFGNKLVEADWDKDSDEVFHVELGFNEALVNAMKHGNKNNPTKKVYVAIEINKDRICVRIRDEGEGFNPEGISNPLSPESLHKENGRGLFLMKGYFDSVTYNEKGNEVTLIKEKK